MKINFLNTLQFPLQLSELCTKGIGLLIIMTFLFAFNVNAQDKKITIKEDDKPLSEILNQVKAKTGYSFLVKSNDVDLNQIVSIDAKDKSIKEFLTILFKSKDINFEISGKSISIFIPQKPQNKPNLSSEKRKVSGMVTDLKGDPIIGASIIIKGTSTVTVSDINGKFSLDVPSNGVLKVTYIGYSPKEIAINNQKELKISLSEDSKLLDDVVVVGYGTQIKESVTGSVQQVKMDDLKGIPAAQFTQELQGKLSGVQISQTTGKPGQDLAVRIRGQASISGGNDPLYVVDGFPIVGGLSSINASEIESISVLKDASSTSLYGSRAANGVVLITTRQGKIGTTSVNIDSYFGIQTVPMQGRPDMMNAREFAQFKKEIAIENNQTVDPAYQNPDQYGEGTDWYGILMRNALVQNHNITISSRTDRMGVNVIAGMFDQQGVMLNTGFKRYSLRINTDFKLNNYIKIGFNMAPNYVQDKNFNTDGSLWGGSILQSAILTSPLVPYKNADGSIPLTATGAGLFPNPNWYNVIQQLDAKGERLEVLSNAFVEITPLKGLTLKSTINFDIGRQTFTSFNNSQIGGIFNPPPTVPSASEEHDDFSSWLTEHTVTFNKSFGEHNFEALLGFTAQQWTGQNLSSSATGYSDDLIHNFSAAPASKRSTSNSSEAWTLVSYLGRLNYNYASKYFLSAAIRRDGSSRFGVDNRYGSFPSASLGWILSKEKFMPKIDIVNLIKLRSSVGTIGNNNIGNYSQRGLISTSNGVFNNNIYSGRTVSSIGNSMLNWEQTKQIDAGLDLGFLNNRINFSYDYYKKNTSNLLFTVPIPQASGFSSILSNIGELEFWGHEFLVSAKVLNGPVKLSVDVNYSYNDNKVVSLATPTGTLKDDRHITKVGQRIGLWYGLVHEGVYVNQADYNASPKYPVAVVGSAKYKDVSGDGKITQEDDRTVLGNSVPTSLFGFTIKMEYKNFDLNIIGTGAGGYSIVNSLDASTKNLDGVFNVTRDVADRWKSETNPGNGLYGCTLSGSTYTERDWFNSRFLQNGNYLIIKNITLGYNMPLNKSFIKSARIYTSVQQPFVFTKYKGFNPEVAADGNPLYSGVDNTAYPAAKTYTLGINLNF